MAQSGNWSQQVGLSTNFTQIDETAKTISITTPTDLALLADMFTDGRGVKGGYAGWTITLTNDIDLSEHVWDMPIGSEHGGEGGGNWYQFIGTFDGGGHTISGFLTDSEPLFGYVGTTATVKNVLIADAKVSRISNCGALVGINLGSVTNCAVATTVTVTAYDNKNHDTPYNLGLIVGQNRGTVTGYVALGTVSDGGIQYCNALGGIVGYNNGGTSGTYFGGIAGANYIKVSNCLYIGATVQGKEYVGAIAGYTGNVDPQRNLYRGLMTGFGGDLSQPAVATGVGMGGYNSGNVLKDYENYATQAFRRASKPDGIGEVVETYGEGEGITVYENGLYYDGAYYSSEKLALQDNADNSSLISSSEADADVVISGRTLYKDGRWNTICLPFAVKRAGSIFANATVKTLQNSTYDEATGTLTLNFTNNNPATLEAGKPYIVKWNSTEAAELRDPVFLGVTLTDELQPVENAAVIFQGHYSPLNIASGDKATLCLSTANQMALPEADTTIGAFRCSLHLKALEGIGALDILQLVNMVLGKTEQTANGDTRVSIADITTLIDQRVNGGAKVIKGNAGLTLGTSGDNWR